MARRPERATLAAVLKATEVTGAALDRQEGVKATAWNNRLKDLYQKRLISLDVAMGASSNRDELQDMINRGVGVVAGAGMGRTTGTVAPPRPVAR